MILPSLYKWLASYFLHYPFQLSYLSAKSPDIRLD